MTAFCRSTAHPGRNERVRIHVAPDNEAAIRLYRAAGFEPFAREPRALKIDGVYHDSLLMTLPFGKMA
ncbi:GNAT family N-acetyltransferase [Caballeronia telluris]|uniref:GNAT family N-acetyltransferase n=1 Tax=Caballeronia telluris TaxID=326475 RepID=UPI00190E670D|nr:GNAT family protein [Caballeronia telluris]